MSDNKPKPRLTFWGERIESEPQGFKQRLREQQAKDAAAAEAAEKAAKTHPKK